MYNAFFSSMTWSRGFIEFVWAIIEFLDFSCHMRYFFENLIPFFLLGRAFIGTISLSILRFEWGIMRFSSGWTIAIISHSILLIITDRNIYLLRHYTPLYIFLNICDSMIWLIFNYHTDRQWKLSQHPLSSFTVWSPYHFAITHHFIHLLILFRTRQSVYRCQDNLTNKK